MVILTTLVVLVLRCWMIEDTDENNFKFCRIEGIIKGTMGNKIKNIMKYIKFL